MSENAHHARKSPEAKRKSGIRRWLSEFQNRPGDEDEILELIPVDLQGPVLRKIIECEESAVVKVVSIYDDSKPRKKLY